MRVEVQRLCGKCTPSAFGISPYGKATHDDLRVASLLQIMFAATPKGETSFLSCGEAAVHLATSYQPLAT